MSNYLTGKKRYHFLYWLLFICVLLEVLCNTFWISPPNPGSSFGQFLTANRKLISVIYFVAGIAIGIIFTTKAEVTQIKIGRFLLLCIRMIIAPVFLIGVFGMYAEAGKIFATTPLDYKIADMLPVIRIMNERFLNHESVYAVIPQFWKGTTPVYLPAMWMPYLPATILNIDIRWISFAFLMIAIVIILFSGSIKKKNLYSLVAIIPLIFLCYYLFCIDTHLIAWNEESVVIGYYLLLAFALTTQSNILKSVAISLCLLSRFSFAGWLPFFFLYEFFFDSKRNAMLLGLYTLLICAILMWFSQGFLQLGIFSHLHSYYFSAILDHNNAWKYRPLIDESLGLVKFIGFDSINVAQTISIAATILFPVIALWWAWKKPVTEKSNFLIGMLKISLVLFYNLLIMPYLYLFYVSTFLSVFMLFRFSSRSIRVLEEKSNQPE